MMCDMKWPEYVFPLKLSGRVSAVEKLLSDDDDDDCFVYGVCDGFVRGVRTIYSKATGTCHITRLVSSRITETLISFRWYD